MNKLEEKLKGKIKEDVNLKPYNSLRVGGLARYFFEAKKVEDLMSAILAAREAKIPYLILGNGSNVLISDKGFNGLVISNRTANISFMRDKAQVIVDSGVMLPRLIMQAAEYNLGGLDALFGIPGTVGGAIYGNAGANRVEICQLIKSIVLLNTDGKIIRCKKNWLQPEYRTTKLKTMHQSSLEIPVILNVTLQLMPRKKDEIIKKIQYFQNLRLDKQPYDKLTCGSVFKNPGKGIEGSAGYILDSAGVKGKKIGKAQISKKHANFIENRGEATAEDIKNLIDFMKDTVKEKKDINLETEVEFIGEFE